MGNTILSPLFKDQSTEGRETAAILSGRFTNIIKTVPPEEQEQALDDTYQKILQKGNLNDNISAILPEIINQSAERRGWLCKMELTNPEDTSKLMDNQAYRDKIKIL